MSTDPTVDDRPEPSVSAISLHDLRPEHVTVDADVVGGFAWVRLGTLVIHADAAGLTVAEQLDHLAAIGEAITRQARAARQEAA